MNIYRVSSKFKVRSILGCKAHFSQNKSRMQNESGIAELYAGGELKHVVFVYGTLKRNEPNDLLQISLRGKGVFAGMARTVDKWPLVIASRYNLPYLLYERGIGKCVLGELYRVDDEMLSWLDEFETHPIYYTREKEQVCILDEAGTVSSPWIYFLKTFRPTLLDLPHLDNYTSKGAHGLEYFKSDDIDDPEGIYET